jgi:hypothetical protein
MGVYSDGSQHPLLNSTINGSSGTWTSSNPLVMYVSQTRLAWANSPGTAIIRYTSPGGVNFSEWIMNVNAPADRLSLGNRQGRLGLEPVGAELVISPKFDLRVDAGRGGFAL